MAGAEVLKRVFLALPLDPFRPEVERFLSRTPRVRGIKWVEPGHFHLTLHFFGEVTDPQVETILKWVTPILIREPSFNLSLRATGFFPDEQRPRVLWAGLEGETGRLKLLQSEVESALKAAGFPCEDRPFQAHATLGRIKDISLFRSSWDSGRYDFPETPKREVDRALLYQSRLAPSGAQYEILKTFPFSKKPQA